MERGDSVEREKKKERSDGNCTLSSGSCSALVRLNAANNAGTGFGGLRTKSFRPNERPIHFAKGLGKKIERALKVRHIFKS